MCLAVPGQVMETWTKDSTLMANVNFGGIVKEVCLEFVPDLQVGEYTIVHVGFALQRLDEASALETLALIAYRQPLTRAAIEAVRGVDSGGVVNTLLARGLIEEVGRLETAGRPILYATTAAFLRYLGLSSLHELPSL